MKTKVLYLFISTYALCNALDLNDFKIKREQILRDESVTYLGGNTSLNDKEIELNACLMVHKSLELNYAFENPGKFNFSNHYFSYKANIKDSKVYKIIKDLPKGAVLHLHDRALLGVDHVIKLTYMDNLYICLEDEIQLKFSDTTPEQPCGIDWQLISEIRKSLNNVTKFDDDLGKHFTLVVDNPDLTYPTIKETWESFMRYLDIIDELITYKPVWEKYFYEALSLFKEHNIMYVEVRSVLPNLYDLNGTVYDRLTTAKTYESAINRFKKHNPDFIGAKIIYSPFRKMDATELEDHIEFATRLKETMPDLFAGFDIVGQEDLGRPLIDFVPQLLDSNLDYYFHAGETNWNGYTDNNLIDAILLGAKRIGHAYALNKHPILMKEVLEKDIALEVNVISNAVLSLVRDVRNHPLSVFLSQGLPVVLSSDDFGAWDGDVISEDYYIAFLAVANRQSDLRLLKTLAFNSLKYSALGVEEKNKALNDFGLQWNSFVENFACSLY